MLHLFLVLMFNSEENDVKAVFHEAHPERETDKGAVKSVRDSFRTTLLSSPQDFYSSF